MMTPSLAIWIMAFVKTIACAQSWDQNSRWCGTLNIYHEIGKQETPSTLGLHPQK